MVLSDNLKGSTAPLLLLVWLGLMPGCQRLPEELIAPELTPIVAVPIVDTRFDLGDVLDVLTDSLATVPVETGQDGELIFVHTERFEGTLAEEWLQLPDWSESLDITLDAATAEVLNLAPENVPVAFSESLTASYPIDQPDDARLSRVELNGGALTLTLTSDLGDEVGGEMIVPNLVDSQGLPWSTAWSPAQLESGTFSVAQDLTGWSMIPENSIIDTNVVTASFTVYVANDPGHTAVAGESMSVSLSMEGLSFARAEGDFGQAEIRLEEGTSTLALFDDRFVTAGLGLNRASIRLEITNGFGVSARLDSLRLETVSGGEVLASLETSEPALEVLSALDSYANPSLSSWTLNQDNSNIVDLFTEQAVDVNLGLAIVANPQGLGPEEVNFVDAEGFVDATFTAELPLSIRAEQVDFRDTLGFDLDLESSEELDSVELRVILENGFPFSVTLQGWFLSPAGEALDSLALAPLDVFAATELDGSGIPLAPAIFRHDFVMDLDRSDRLREADRIVVQAWCRTASAEGAEFVRITENQDLRMQIGALLYTRIQP